MALAAGVPWWVKLWAKLLLARLPIPYGFWRRLGLFRHGDMNVPERAIAAFESCFRMARSHGDLPPGFSSLELGPGDSVLSGLVARAHGAGSVWLVDAGQYADTDPDACRQTVALLRAQGMSPPDLEKAGTLAEVLRLSGVHYLTSGTASLQTLPPASIDYFWSQVVLEHVPRTEFPEFVAALRRAVKDTAIGVHCIDFRDHLGGGLNNLRYAHARWEAPLFRSSGFYTNRLRPREMLALFVAGGFSVEVIRETRWPEMPIRREQLAPEFQAFEDEDFMVAELELILRPVGRTETPKLPSA